MGAGGQRGGGQAAQCRCRTRYLRTSFRTSCRSSPRPAPSAPVRPSVAPGATRQVLADHTRRSGHPPPKPRTSWLKIRGHDSVRSRLTLAVFRTSAEDEDLWYGMCRDKGWGTEEDGMRAPGLSGRVHAPDAGLFQPAERRAHGAGAQGCDWRSRFVARFLQEVELKRRARSTLPLTQSERVLCRKPTRPTPLHLRDDLVDRPCAMGV